MSDVQNTPNTDPEVTEADQAIASLKKQADRMGIPYKSNTSVATLQKLIKERLEAPIGGEDSKEPKTAEGTGSKKQLTKGELAEANYKEAMKLVRVIITPMEATKATNLESEMFCAGNSLVGTVKRTIPFGVEWHVEQILINSIKEKKYQMFISKKNHLGVDVVSARMVPAYSITTLDPLTQEELDKLADLQLRTGSLQED